MSLNVSIIVPVKNEPHLPDLLDALDFHMPTVTNELIVVIGDRNKKNLSLSELTDSMATAHPVNIRIVKSYGDSLERAILLGFSVAKGKKLIVMDGDGSHPPELVPKMIKELDDYEMVIASRFVNGSEFKSSILRRFVTYMYIEYARLCGSNLTDPMSGFFGIQSQLLEKIKFKPYKWKTALEINKKLQPKTKEIPFTFHNRKSGKSHTNWRIGLKLIWDMTVDAI